MSCKTGDSPDNKNYLASHITCQCPRKYLYNSKTYLYYLNLEVNSILYSNTIFLRSKIVFCFAWILPLFFQNHILTVIPLLCHLSLQIKHTSNHLPLQ